MACCLWLISGACPFLLCWIYGTPNVCVCLHEHVFVKEIEEERINSIKLLVQPIRTDVHAIVQIFTYKKHAL